MNRKTCAGLLAFISLVFAFLTGCSSSSSSTPKVAITATSGGGQTAQVEAPFTSPLVATVNSNGSPASGVSVTFTAPGSGASGTFATTPAAATDTETTNSSGVATSQPFTANTIAGTYTVTATAAGMGGTSPAAFTLTNNPGAPAALQATSGNSQSATVGTPFAYPLVATVVDSDGNTVPGTGVSITFTAPAQTGASGLFQTTATGTEVDQTTDSGVAMSSQFSANAIGGGPYNVVASFPGLTSANFALTNTAVVAGSNTYVFYLSGQEAINSGPNYYALAGSVTIDSLGDTIGGEQDYNDGVGFKSPNEPTPDGILAEPAALVVDPTTGQGTLTLTTTNPNWGNNGVETLGVQFVNASHALVIQFDGSATSSGSLDLQTPSSTLGGGYALSISGVDKSGQPNALGGVFTVTGGTAVSGTVDQNDDGTVTMGNPFSGTFSSADGYGRGTLAISGSTGTIVYYIVGPEVIRLIDVDTDKSSLGSAFGQGANATAATNATLASPAVFNVLGNPWSIEFAALGQFSTSNTSAATADFSGVAEDNELLSYGTQSSASPILGTYNVASNGYGSLTITATTPPQLGDFSVLGIYLTDPTLNLNDPNNSSGGGGALVLDLDPSLPGGTGVLVPQTDTATADFEGNYAVGWQNENNYVCAECEFDMIAQGSLTAGALSFTGLVSDPSFTLSSVATSAGNTFTGTPLADPNYPGRYTMLSTNPTPNPLSLVINATAPPTSYSFDLVLYQASAGQLFWLGYDDAGNSVSLGPLQQQGSLTGIPATKKAAAKFAKPKP